MVMIEIFGFMAIAGVVGWIFGTLFNVRLKVHKEEARMWKSMYHALKSHLDKLEVSGGNNDMLTNILNNPVIMGIARQFAKKYGIDLDALIAGVKPNTVQSEHDDNKERFISEWR